MTATFAAPGATTAVVFGTAPNPHRPWSYETGSAKRVQKLAGRKLQWWNLYGREPEVWDAEDAKLQAERWCRRDHVTRPPLLLLGTRVCAAFGIVKPMWLEWYASAMWRPMIAVPHPSGLNRWWNDEANVERARELLRQVASGKLPHQEK